MPDNAIMDLDDFDSEEEQAIAVPSGMSKRDMLEADQTNKMVSYRSMKERIVSPEVARAIREGWTIREIAEALGVSQVTVSKHLKSADMSDLLDREARRVLRHMLKRDLSTEKYKDLAIAMGVINDKARIIRHEPTEIVEHRDTGIDRLAYLLFGETKGIGGCGPIVEITPETGTEGLPGLLESPESPGHEDIRESDVCGDEPGSSK